MNKQEHNGWTNYETWAVALWLDNEQGSQLHWHEMAKECLEGARHIALKDESLADTKHEAACRLQNVLQDEHEDARPEVTGVFADLLSAAMSEVNWYEIAKHYIDEVANG